MSEKTLNEKLPFLDQCKPMTASTGLRLSNLQARWLEPAPGKTRYMRMLQPREDLTRARAVYFRCPRCGPKHMITLPFDFPDTPIDLKPLIRANPIKWPVQMQELSIREGIKLPCGIEGFITNGTFNFRSM